MVTLPDGGIINGGIVLPQKERILPLAPVARG